MSAGGRFEKYRPQYEPHWFDEPYVQGLEEERKNNNRGGNEVVAHDLV
jgi:hypothetical protein